MSDHVQSATDDEKDDWVLDTFGVDPRSYPKKRTNVAIAASDTQTSIRNELPNVDDFGRSIAALDTGVSPQKIGFSADSTADRFKRVIEIAATKLGGAVGEKLKQLLTPESISVMIAFTGLYIAAQATPAGWFADGVAVLTITVTALLVGKEIFGIIDDLRAFVRITKDPNGDLDDAAQHLANAVSAVGIDVILAVLLHKGSKAAVPYLKPPAGFVEVVTTDGRIIRMPAQALEKPAGNGPNGSEPLRMKGDHARGGGAEPPDRGEYEAALAKGDYEAAAKKIAQLETKTQLQKLASLPREQLNKLHSALEKAYGKHSPQVRMADSAHRDNLEFDPASRRPRPNERNTALRVERKLSVELKRYEPDLRRGEKGDWISADGKVYDGCSPAPARYFDADMRRGNFKASLRDHLQHPKVDYVVVDVSDLGLSAEQLHVLESAIEEVAGKNSPKIVHLP